VCTRSLRLATAAAHRQLTEVGKLQRQHQECTRYGHRPAMQTEIEARGRANKKVVGATAV
jgi:hypothetical protein